MKIKLKRGLSLASKETRQRVASAGGKSVSMDREHMVRIGRKGGMTVSFDRKHMANIGRRGGASRQQKLRSGQEEKTLID